MDTSDEDTQEVLSADQRRACRYYDALARIARTEFVAPEDYDDREAYSWAQDQIHGVIRIAREALGGEG